VPVTVVVLAAGQGKRMRSELPKVLQPLAGRPLLGHVLDRARELSPAAIDVVYGHGADRVRETFDEADLRWCLQDPQLGTGHAVAQAMPDIPDDHRVLILCGDVPLVSAKTLKKLVAADTSRDVHLLTAILSDASGYGRIVRDAQGKVVRVTEDKDASELEREINEINAGLIAAAAGDLKRWITRLDNDNAQGEYYLPDVLPMALEEGVNVEGIVVDDADEVMGINDKAQLAFAERKLQHSLTEDLMRQGVTFADPARCDVRGRVTVGRDVFIDVNAVFEGEVRLGDRVRVGPNCVVSNTSLGADTVVHAHTVMDGLTTGSRCEIGPYARIRPGTELAEQVKVGNFVEIKNSHVGDGSKINHLSYIGDTTIGSKVNVGAGTITCNYDGAAKHRTVIGDNAFIGSGVMLVAPIEVGAGATIGAGSTLSRDAPGGELSLARTGQTTVEGWQRPVKPSKGQ